MEAGWHERSIDWVRSGQVDASAIDSHVLVVAVRDDPGLRSDLRIIGTDIRRMCGTGESAGFESLVQSAVSNRREKTHNTQNG